MLKRFYVTDLDGTLLNSKGKLSEYSVAALNHLIDNDVMITFATARSLGDFCEIMKEVKVQLPVITFNGGYISDANTKIHLKKCFISNDITKSIYELLSQEVGVLVSHNHENDDFISYDNISSKGMSDYILEREATLKKSLGRFEIFNFKDVMAFTVIDEKEKVLFLKNELIHKYGDIIKIEAWEDMYFKSWYWLTVHNMDATKGKALQKLREMVDITFDSLVVFGDQMNDLDMIKGADYSFAVGNAVETIKKNAHDVIGHHNQNSVVNKILELEGMSYDTFQK